MRTYRADLRIMVHMQALTGHCSQAIIFENAMIMSEFDGSRTEWPGLCECRQLNHFFYMFSRKRNGLYRIFINFVFWRKDKLKSFQRHFYLPPFGFPDF